MDIEEETNRIMKQVADIQVEMQENLKMMEQARINALKLRAEHTALQAAFRAYLEGDITAEEARTVLNNCEWN